MKKPKNERGLNMSFVNKFLRSNKKTFTPEEVAKLFHVHSNSVRRWCSEGLLSYSLTIGGHRRIPREAIMARLSVGATPNY